MTFLPELAFPNYLPKADVALSGKPGPDIGGMEGLEHPNWPNDPQGRLVWKKHPKDPARLALRMELRDGDLCSNQYGPDGQRLEFWTPSGYKHENVEGGEAWYAGVWYAGDGIQGDFFRYPTSPWMLIFQHHDGNGSPPNEMTVNALGEVFWTCRVAGNDYAAENAHKVGKLVRGSDFYFINYQRFSVSSGGISRMWVSNDGWPDTSKVPSDERLQRNLYGNNNGLTTVHMYRLDGVATDYPCTLYMSGFGRSSSAAKAIAACPILPQLGAGPPPMTNAELAAKAEAHFKDAKVLYPTYVKNLAAGKYPDPLKTAWGAGLDAQHRIT